ncbi:hypothetical protein PCYB_062260 [Plasmodium cynomolgi strain B]|uniref:CYIR protein n=1 Tax=Plasmodium cynomolgi (strain B) TaxID=1120755 RepID=K6UR49_PLACD|nr:hypothetical protein PCYB_062260 [Plasmodium cynomolgi strain B]GAB65494.1 hypothetical protein PCYB_062260 [Plasmodium cynomolgi strain B]
MGSCNGKYEQILGELKDELKNHAKSKAMVNNILNAWIYISNKKNYVQGTFCELFYYWLGDLISKDVNTSTSSSFSKTMQNVYGILKNCSNIDKCKNKYPGIDTGNFERMKELYDYKYYYREWKSNRKSCSLLMEEVTELRIQ